MNKIIPYVLNTVKSMYSYNRQKLICSNMPLIPSIELTSICDLNCVFCSRENIKHRGLGLMKEDTFNKIVNKENLKALRNFRLNVHGESLLHPHLEDYVKKAKKYCNSVGFSTNALKLNITKSLRLLDAGVNALTISFEGTTKETYEQLRRGSNFEKVQQNILDFIGLKNELKSNCSLTIAIIDTKETNALLGEFIKKWSVKGVNGIQILKLHDWGGVHDYDNCSTKLKGSVKEVCLWAWLGLYVLYDGSISPCCVYEPRLNENMIPLGNVNDNSIKEIWNSTAYQQFRLGHTRGRLIIINGKRYTTCETCKIANLGIGRHDYLDVKEPSFKTFSKQMFNYGLWNTKRILARLKKPKEKTKIGFVGN